GHTQSWPRPILLVILIPENLEILAQECHYHVAEFFAFGGMIHLRDVRFVTLGVDSTQNLELK
ncbi:hypothetical protein PMAYCL1PPCAC_18516, partial [Pristionchus mayeri]